MSGIDSSERSSVRKWKEKLPQYLSGLRNRMEQVGSKSLYFLIAASSLIPLVEAMSSGNDGFVLLALNELLTGVGYGLITEVIQGWKNEHDAADQLKHAIELDPTLFVQIEEMLHRLDAIPLAASTLDDTDKQWLIDTIQRELHELQSEFEVQYNYGEVVIGGDVKELVVNTLDSSETKNIINLNFDLSRGREDPGSFTNPSYRVYLDKLIHHCQVMPMAEFGMESFDRQAMNLDDVYISLNTTTYVEDYLNLEDQERGILNVLHEGDNDLGVPISALKAFEENRKIILLGDPGSGKSTFARAIASTYAKTLRDGQGLIPILVAARDIVSRLADNPIESKHGRKGKLVFARLLRDSVVNDVIELFELETFAPALKKAFESGNCLFIIDGLDEVSEDRQKVLLTHIHAANQEYGFQRILMTCRTRSYHKNLVPSFFSQYSLSQFNESQIEEFIHAWYGSQGGNASESEKRIKDLVKDALQNHIELAKNPLLLTTMAILHQKNVTLPDKQVQLYADAVKLLIVRWQKSKDLDGRLSENEELNTLLSDAKRILQLMERLGFEAHKKNSSAGSKWSTDKSTALERGSLLALLEDKQLLGDLSLAKSFLDYIDFRAGLLIGLGGGKDKPHQYKFPHRTFQEYLAGCYLFSNHDVIRKVFHLALESDYWALAVQLGAEERLFNSGEEGSAVLKDLAYALMPSILEGQQNLRAALWSAKMAALVGPNEIRKDNEHPQGGQNFLEKTQRALTMVLTSELSVYERVEGGNALSILGDLRFNDNLYSLPLDDFLGFKEIHGGKWFKGSDKEVDAQYKDRELPLRIEDEEFFYLSRWQVTVAQYQAFLDHVSGDMPSANHYMNHPVVGISHSDAKRYCDWLTEALRTNVNSPRKITALLESGWEISLPSANQWEKAARGTEGNIFPWGNIFSPERANTKELGLAQTCSVGVFHESRSNYDVEDVCGNVWEWTDSWRNEREEQKIIKGGSWKYSSSGARCAYEDYYSPHKSSALGGFRIALVKNYL